MDRVCLKVLGPGFCIGMTIDVDPAFPIITVGDLLRSLRTQPELAAVCRFHNNCDGRRGDLYYRNVRLVQPNARLLQDVGIDRVTLTRGGVETLEYRIQSGNEQSATVDTSNDNMGEDFKAATKTVLSQDDPTFSTLTGLLKVMGNICQNPDNPKYQKIKRANPKFQQLVGSHPGAIQVLLACGFRDHVILDGDEIEYIQFQQSEENLEKLKQAVDIFRLMQEQLYEAHSLVDTSKGGPLAVVPSVPAQQSLQIYLRILGPRHVLVAKGMGLVATVLYAQGQDQDAMDPCREAKEMLEELAGPEHPALAPILANLAYMLRNDVPARPEMEQFLARALALQQPEPTMDVLNISAGLQLTLGHYDAAIAQWQQVLEAMNESDPGYFVILGNVARARAESHDDTGAERDYQVAIQAAERQVGHSHLQLAGILANLGTVQDRLGRVDEAESNLERALNIREGALSFGNPLTQQVFRVLCELLERKKKYSKLSDHLRRCTDYTQQVLGARHPGTAKSFMNAALVLHRFQNNAREAIPLLRHALGIYQAALGPDHSDTVMTAIHLGCALQNEDSVEAESILVEAVSTAEFRNDQQSLGPALSTLGALDVDKGDYEMAFVRLERGLRLNVQAHGNDVWYTEMNRRDLGRAYQATGRPERAKDLYRICSEYFESTLETTDERLVGLLRDIEQVESR